EVYAHFLISFLISGLIALTYSYFAFQYIVLRILYPLLWADARGAAATVRAELRRAGVGISWFQAFAVLIPLAGAVLLVGIGAEGLESGSERIFRMLVAGLIM